MKRGIVSATGLFLLLFSVLAAFAQTGPFSVKMKPAKAAGSATFMPQPLKTMPGPAAGTTGRLKSVPAFRPVTHPMPPVTVNRTCFTDRHWNASGQLIFLSGILPGGISLDRKSTATAGEACFEYLDAIRADLRVVNPREEFIIRDRKNDESGTCHIRMQQVFRGIPVYGGEIYLHSSGDRIGLFNGNPWPTPGISDIIPAVTPLQAQLTAIMDVSSRTAYHELSGAEKSFLRYDGPACELVIYHKDRDPLQEHLSWHLTVRPNFLERWEYFIDAKTGSVIHYYNNTQSDGDVTATGPDLNGVTRTVHAYLQGGTYIMIDVSRPMFNSQTQEGTISTYDANYTCPSSPGFNPPIASSSSNSWQPKVISAQYNAGLTYEYYRSNYSRNSWNNLGGSLLNVINATEENGSGLDNAYWNGICMVFGNGNSMFKPLAGALDVCAHEIGHAYDESSANLEYQSQSGAMNEAFADISGAMVEKVNWKMGEDIVLPGVFPTGCLRDMSNPHNGGNAIGDPGYQPANVSEMYTGTEDNGGVHLNSGIINYAFYKYATAIGTSKAEQIFFKVLLNYLTRSSQFIDCRLAVVQVAKDLYGDGSTEMNAAKTAFDEVGITDGTGGNYQNTLPVNPGPDYILSYDPTTGANYTLYISSTTGTNFNGISQTGLINKPSIVDNGSVAVFVGSDKMIHAITLGSSPQETIIENEPVWSNVAVSKDGTKIAAVTQYEDSAIWLYSYALQSWAKAHLYNPTTQQGVVTNNVLYADALEWDYTGEYLMYDAYNQMNSSTGQNVDYWDISFMNVWNNATGGWGSGEVYKLVSGIPEGVSIGNPSLSKNSPSVCAFDYYDGTENTDYVLAANLETGDFVGIFNNGTTLSYPNYSKLDDKIIFTGVSNGEPAIGYMDMQPDKIHPVSTQAYVLISQAQWGVWFAQGTRAFGIPESAPQAGFTVYPNPTGGIVELAFEKPVTGRVNVEVFDFRGIRVYSSQPAPDKKLEVDLGGLNDGLYLLKVTGADISGTRKVVIAR